MDMLGHVFDHQGKLSAMTLCPSRGSRRSYAPPARPQKGRGANYLSQRVSGWILESSKFTNFEIFMWKIISCHSHIVMFFFDQSKQCVISDKLIHPQFAWSRERRRRPTTSWTGPETSRGTLWACYDMRLIIRRRSRGPWRPSAPPARPL